MDRYRNCLETSSFDLHDEVYVESKDGCGLISSIGNTYLL